MDQDPDRSRLQGEWQRQFAPLARGPEVPYQDVRKHPADFEVSYRFYPPEEGGRKLTYQHLRCDWAYDGDDVSTTGIFMIHPEFLDVDGSMIAGEVPIPLEGTATMWVVSPAMREYHRSRIEVGVKGYFMEGARRVGEATVTRVVALHTNPVE